MRQKHPLHIAWTVLFGVVACGWIVQAARAGWGMLHVPWLHDVAPVADTAAPSISIVLAARDEAEKLPSALPTLLHQDYPNYEVIAVDDRSKDATPNILRESAETIKRASEEAKPGPSRLKVLHISELPPGWLGKPHALWSGAQEASGEWLLFTDADVRFAPDTLRRAAALAIERKWDHLTLLAGLEMRGFWEKTFLSYFALGFILANEPWLVANPKSSRYASVGAFQLLRRSAYDAIRGHRALAMEVVDDMRLGKLVKLGGFSSGFAMAPDFVSLRWYSGLGRIVSGLTKNMFAAMNFSVPLTLANSLLIFGANILPFLGVLFAGGWARVFAATAAAVALGFHAAAMRRSTISPLYALTQPLGAAMFLYVVARSTAVTLARRGIAWRGTFYPLDELRRGSV